MNFYIDFYRFYLQQLNIVSEPAISVKVETFSNTARESSCSFAFKFLFYFIF